jgi:hypothetical protein
MAVVVAATVVVVVVTSMVLTMLGAPPRHHSPRVPRRCSSMAARVATGRWPTCMSSTRRRWCGRLSRLMARGPGRGCRTRWCRRRTNPRGLHTVYADGPVFTPLRVLHRWCCSTTSTSSAAPAATEPSTTCTGSTCTPCSGSCCTRRRGPRPTQQPSPAAPRIRYVRHSVAVHVAHTAASGPRAFTTVRRLRCCSLLLCFSLLIC